MAFIRWFESLRRNNWGALAVAVLWAVTALLLRLALLPITQQRGPYIFFLLATLGSAALSGFRLGLLTAASSVLLAGFSFPPGGFAHLVDPADPWGILRFSLAALVTCYICHLMVGSRERARQAERRAQQAQAELSRQAEELRRSNRDLEQFAFVASHDIREPLRTINIYTQLLLRTVRPDPASELNQYAEHIRDGVQRIERMIGDLLEFSRVLEPGVEKVQVDSGRIAREAVRLCEASVQESQATIVIDDLPGVLAGEAHVSQLFQNLISNAIKYRKPGVPPQVRISGRIEGAQVSFQVRDNGMGFDPQYAQKVFKLFGRLHGREYAGTGLGLAICQRIVEQYGGTIRAESQAGEGSTFFFTLPAADSAARSTEAR